MSKTIEDLKQNLSGLNNEIKKMKEKELLLLQYPDLYGPIPVQKDTDIIKDMELQIQANRHRIQLLESQNQALKNSIQKLFESEKKTTTVQSPQQSINTTNQNNNKNNNHINENLNVARPVPLFKLENEISESRVENTQAYWNQTDSIAHNQHQKSLYKHENEAILNTENIFVKTIDNIHHNNAYENIHGSYYTQDAYYNGYSQMTTKKHDEQHSGNFVKPDTNRRNSISGSSSSHRNLEKNYANRTVTPISAPVKDMEMVIGRGHRPNSASRPPSAVSKNPAPTNRSNISKVDMKNKFICEKCNKIYGNKKDLDIHKLYCNR